MVERGVAGDPLERDGVVQDEVGEKSTMLVTPRGIVGKEKTVAFEVFPEQLRGQWVILGSVLRETFRDL
jgi:hypothetical protein